MTQQIINIGSAINDGTGDPARVAFTHCNENFTELYTLVRPTGQTIEYQFNNTITEPPSTGQIRFNQATQASTTKLWASHTASSGINIKQFLAAATTGAKLVLQDKIDNTNYIKFDVTGAPVDKTTYWEFAVAVTASGGNLPNAAILAAVTAAATAAVGQPQRTVFTASGTWTKPSGCTYVEVEVCLGGGGAGGNADTTAGAITAGGGGASGGWGRGKISAASLGSTVAVTVGGGGGVFGGSNSAGGNGGTSSFGAFIVANGGGGGGGGSNTPVNQAAPGTPSTAVGGELNVPGNYGGRALACMTGPTFIMSGYGANSPWGAGGPAVIGAGVAGIAGSSYGAGGSGGGSYNGGGAATGGAGGAGVVVVVAYFN